MSSSVDLVGAVALLGFAALSFVDGVWLHLLRFRLHERRESRREHLIHTGRAVLFPMLLATLFIPSWPSLPLWLGLAVLAADQALELIDMAIERASRSASGGLGSGEYVVHGLAITLRSVAVGAALLLHANDTPFAGLLSQLATWLLPGSIVVALVHVALVLRPDLTASLKHRFP